MNRLLVLALAMVASNAFAVMPSADLISDAEELIPACYPLGAPFEPECGFGGDFLN